MTRSLVIGIGNPDRGDDAVGPMVAKLLAGRLPPTATILTRAGDMLGLIEDWIRHDNVILIDAAAPITAPGTIHRIDLLHDVLPAGLSLASTHAFGVAEAVALARALDQLPASLIAYAVEAGTFAPGASPTQAVVAAAETVAARVTFELNHDRLRLTVGECESLSATNKQ